MKKNFPIDQPLFSHFLRLSCFVILALFSYLLTANAQPEFSRSELELIKKQGSYSDAAKLRLPQEHFPNPPISASRALPADGNIDPTFNASVTDGFGYVYDTAVQPDGKIIAVGLFQRANGTRTNGIARFNADGSIDASFNTGGGANLAIRTIALQTDGKIIIGGAFTSFNNVAVNRIVRLNSNGSVDGSFNLGVVFNGQVNDVLILSSGKIMVGGQFAISSSRLVRLNSNGTLDSAITSFNNTVYSIATSQEGKIIVGGSFSLPKPNVARLNGDGTLDPLFSPTTGTPGFPVFKVIVLPNSKVIAAGVFSTFNGTATDGVVRINENGTVDATFEITNDPQMQNLEVNGLALQPDGKILVGFFDNGSTSFADVRRFNADATPDATFNTSSGNSLSVVDLNLLADGRILAAGYFVSFNNQQRLRLVKLSADGSLDITFNPSVSSFGTVFAIKRQNDGKVLIGGDFEYVNEVRRSSIARLNSDGTLDDTFTIGGELYGDIYAIEVQPDGKILIGGGFSGNPNFPAYAVARINVNGSFDVSLNTTSNFVFAAYALALQPDGKILIAGQIIDQGSTFSALAANRNNSNGSRDESFTPATLPNGTVRAMAIQQDGKIVVGGTFFQQGLFSRAGIARLNADGTLNGTTFAGNSSVFALKQQPDGSIYGGGFTLTRHSSEGILDTTLNLGSGLNQAIRAIDVQPNGKFLIGGHFTTYNGTSVNRIARINIDGSLDSTFNVGSGSPGSIFSLALQPDGKLMVGGQFLDFNNKERLGIVRLQAFADRAPTLWDYDADGRSDLSVRRPTDNIWYILRGTAGYFNIEFGVTGDLIAPADYDGDGKTDVAVFRPSNGTWYIFMSQSQSFQTFSWGADGDLPVPADHDGDGKADLVVFRPSTNTWYTRFSLNNNFSAVGFGVAGDKPVVGDFDGDGKADTALYRPSDNNWYILKTGFGFFVQTWGVAGDIPVPADYDGDGKTDVAVFRPSTGQWFRIQSTAGFDTVNWGASGDQPIPADYDGDGKADVAVFRESNATWYIVGSTSGQLIQNYGAAGDLPTQSAFIY